MTDPILVVVFTSIIVAIAAALVHRRLTNELEVKLKVCSAQANEAERQVHLREMECLAERNNVEVTHVEALNYARSLAFEEGRKQGKTEHELETSMQLADQRNEFAIRLQAEKEQAATEARDKQRAEYELQAKLFSVKISPYVQFLTDKGFFKDTHEANIGYQYQLLVNGIPAFQPHIVVERHENFQQIDPEIKKMFLATAQTCAEVAVTTYLGASPQFAKLAPEVIDEQIKKQ